VDITKLGNPISPISPELKPGGTNSMPKVGDGPSFKETLNSQLNVKQSESLNGASLSQGVKFSNHALDRMESRGIFYSPTDITKLNEAVAKASAKGAKDSLILMNDSALIVSVKNNTVVTVMDKSALKENVFTNIDSTIVM
jgi:flagellar operon protein